MWEDLADHGAGVIKIERHGGDVACDIVFFYHDMLDPELLRFW